MEGQKRIEPSADSSMPAAQPETKGRLPYERPAIAYRAPLEAIAGTCDPTNTGPGKENTIDCNAQFLQS